MQLQLKNIGMIKEASVKIDGLTVIAGENDTGKSTVGKALFFIKEFQNLFIDKLNYKDEIDKKSKYKEKLEGLVEKLTDFADDIDEPDFDNMNNLEDILNFGSSMSGVTSSFEKLTKEIETYDNIIKFIEKLEKKSKSELNELSINFNLKRIKEKFKDFFYFELSDDSKLIIDNKIGIEKNEIIGVNLNIEKPIVFIETPILANLFSFFSKLDTIQTQSKYKINDYPYTLRSLYLQLKLPLSLDDFIAKNDILDNLKDVINGELNIGGNGDLVFKRDDKEFHILSVATGIKTFGIFQILLKNNYLTKGSILILDEPEVHLHPKWQLEMAKIIVELVKNGVKVVVNSHSPYMIEALKVYSENKGLGDKTNFYLAEKNEGEITSSIREVNDDMWLIFEKLSTPLSDLKMTSLDDIL
ncbi:MAG: AAA family ATPase [Sulfurovum sp.]